MRRERHRLCGAACQQRHDQRHHQPLQVHADRALIHPGRPRGFIGAIQPFFGAAGNSGFFSDRLPPRRRHRRVVDFRRDPALVHTCHDLAGDSLRLARQERGGRRRVQLHSADADFRKLGFHAGELDDPGTAGLCGPPANDADRRDNALPSG